MRTAVRSVSLHIAGIRNEKHSSSLEKMPFLVRNIGIGHVKKAAWHPPLTAIRLNVNGRDETMAEIGRQPSPPSLVCGPKRTAIKSSLVV